MKRALATLFVLLVTLIPGVPAYSGTRGASPLVGRWSVDVSRMQKPPQERPKSVTITFADPGSGKWTTLVDVVRLDGTRDHAEGTTVLDGSPSPVQGNFEADIGAAIMPQPNVLIVTLAKQHIAGSTRIYAVAADGNSMVETASYFGEAGRPIIKTNYFTRIR